MNCHSVRNLLDLHAEGRLTLRRQAAVAAHLAACAACRALAAPAAAPSGVRAPAALKAKILAEARAARGAAAVAPEKRSAPGLELWPREATGVAVAALALGLLAACLGWSGVPSQPFDDSVAAVGVK